MQLGFCKMKLASNLNEETTNNKISAFLSKNKNFTLVGDDELTAEGKMYDIVSKKTVKDGVIYYAKCDGEEDEILTKLSGSDKSGAADTGFTVKAGKFFDLKYSVHTVNKCPKHSATATTTMHPLKSAVCYRSYFRDVFSPPPDGSCS